MQVDLSVGAPEAPQVEAEPDVIVVEAEAPAALIDEAMIRRLLELGSGWANELGRDEAVVEELRTEAARADEPFRARKLAEQADRVERVWLFTDRELDALVPALTAYVSRQPRLAAMVARGDQTAVGLILASYMSRNIAVTRTMKEVRGRGDEFGEDRPAAAGPPAGAGGVARGPWPADPHGGPAGHPAGRGVAGP